MAVQRADGYIHMSPDDFQATEDGITYGVKFRYFASIQGTGASILEKIDGDWVVVWTLDDDVEGGIIRAGGPANYAETIIRPRVKAWLANRKLQQPTPADEVAGIVGKWHAL